MGDRMARRTIYDGLTRSEISMLWGIWRHHVSKYCLEWEEVKDFILWAEKHGYIGGAKLLRCNESAPYSPDNCYWDIVPGCFPKGHPCRECERRNGCSNPCPERLRYWDDTMNHIRASFGDVKRKDEI